MTAALIPAAALGLVLGLRHAFEPDHLAAISTLATRQGRPRDGALLGLAWGAGHTTTVAAVAAVVAVSGLRLPQTFSAAAELLVAALLVLLGLPVVARYARGKWHMHAHSHGGSTHLHLHSHRGGTDHAHAHPAWDRRRSFGLGLAHGLAGSAAITVLVGAAAPTPGSQAAYVLAFGVGSTLAMLLVSWGLALMVGRAARGGARLAAALHLGAGAASVLAGVVLGVRTMSGW